MSKINVIGKMSGYEIANRVYNSNGLSPTIRTYGGGGLEPKIMEVLKIKQATNKGYTECVVGGGSGSKLPVIRNSQRTSNRKRQDMSNDNDGEYP